MDLSRASALGVAEVFCYLYKSGLLVPRGLTRGLVTIGDSVENTSCENDLLLNVETAMRARKGPLGKVQLNKECIKSLTSPTNCTSVGVLHSKSVAGLAILLFANNNYPVGLSG